MIFSNPKNLKKRLVHKLLIASLLLSSNIHFAPRAISSELSNEDLDSVGKLINETVSQRYLDDYSKKIKTETDRSNNLTSYKNSDINSDAFVDYLAKIIPQSPLSKNSQGKSPAYEIYDFNKLNYDNGIIDWLKAADAQITRENFPQLDAEFEFTLNRDGYLTSLRLADLKENDFDKFKAFVSSFVEWQAPNLPTNLPENTRFNINAKWGYIDRSYEAGSRSPEVFALQARYDNVIGFSDYNAELEYPGAPLSPELSQVQQTLFKIANQEKVELTLVEPSYIDFPSVGEKIIFKVSQGLPSDAFFQGRVIKVGKRDMTILTSKIKLANGQLASKDLLWQAKAPNPDRGANLIASMTCGAITWMSLVDISTAVATKGIAPGAAIAIGMFSGWLKENDKVHSFDLAKNDNIVINNRSKNK